MARPSAHSAAPLAEARSLLFVPGHRPERFAKALASGADAVILDLEDAVPPAAQAQARQCIQDAWPGLQQSDVPVLVRINGGADAADARWLATLATPPAAVMVPKAESADALAQIAALLPGVPLIPLIESAAGLAAMD